MRREAILIHGAASTSAHTWERNGWLELLEDMDIAVTPVPLPGHVGSTLPAETPLASVVEAVLAAAPESDLLIGFSAGAALALHAALAAKGRITTLVLLGIGDGFWDTTPSSKQDTAERLRQGPADAFTRLMSEMAIATGNTLENVTSYIAASAGPPSLTECGALLARTLIVCGADDTTGPVTGLAAALPDAKVLIPAGVNHFRTTSSPAVMAAVMRFLR